jgi:hypothetical protein
MPPYKAPSKIQPKDHAEHKMQEALNGPYSLIIPLQNARHAWIHHPGTAKTLHVATNSPRFHEILNELTSLGLGVRINHELKALSLSDPKWLPIFEEWTATQPQADLVEDELATPASSE